MFDNIAHRAARGNMIYMAEAGPVPHLPENGKAVIANRPPPRGCLRRPLVDGIWRRPSLPCRGIFPWGRSVSGTVKPALVKANGTAPHRHQEPLTG
jgi:hypothetical protein